MGKDKKCSRCKETKAVSDFPKDRSMRDGIKGHCITCQRFYTTDYRSRNANKVREYWRKYNIDNRDKIRNAALVRNFGITLRVYLRNLEKQGGGCAICGATPGRRNFAVDHCHRTGKIRGILCHTCNVMLGSVEDSVTILQDAIKYLEGYRGGHGG